MALTRVVLPTPGPPVITSTLEVSASATADLRLWAKTSPVRCSIQGIAFSGSIQGTLAVALNQLGLGRFSFLRLRDGPPRSDNCPLSRGRGGRHCQEAKEGK